MQRVRDYFYGNKNCVNPRLKPIADRLFRDIPDAKIMGGYVRGLVHEDKVTSDLDVIVPNVHGLKVATDQLTRNFHCTVSASDQPHYSNWNPTPQTYVRFACPNGVTVDVVTKSEHDKTQVPSSAHETVLTKDGIQFQHESMFRNKQFICYTLGSVSCDKLDREGWKRK